MLANDRACMRALRMGRCYYAIIASKRLVRAVAKWRIFCVLAAAQPFFLGLRDGKFFWCEFAALVRTIAEWLILRTATGAPPIIAGCEFDRIGRFLRRDGDCHDDRLFLKNRVELCA